jgi:hypothetical protein
VSTRHPPDNTPEAHIRLLDQFITLATHLIPPSEICAPVLWHTDLHGSNIMISESGPASIVGFLDWQGTTISPLFMQSGIPPFLRYSGDERIVIEPGVKSVPFPPGYGDLPPEDQQHLARHRRFALRQKYYELQVMQHSPHTFAAQSWPGMEYMMPFVRGMSSTWFQGSHLLRDHIFQCYLSWNNIAPGIPFPFSVDPNDLQRHREEHRRLEIYNQRIEQTSRQLGIEGDGWVTGERYEEVKKASEELMRGWDTETAGGPYPFQDGAPSWFVGS